MSAPKTPLPAPHPHPGREPDDGRGADPPRLGDARPAQRRDQRARHRRGPRGHGPVRGCDPRPPRPPSPPAGPRLRARRRHDPSHRPDRPARRGGHRRGLGRAGGRPHHLRLGRPDRHDPGRRPVERWTRRRRRASRGPAPVLSPTIDEVVRDAPCDIAVIKQRGSQEIRRILVPVRGGPHAELAIRYADAIARYHDATVVVLHLVPPGITIAVRAQAERALAAFVKQHLREPRRGAPARGAQRPQRDPARGREGRPRRHGRLGADDRRGRRDASLRGAPRGDRRPREAVGHRRPDARDPRADDVRAAGRRGPRRWRPPTAPPRRLAPSRSASSAGSANRTSTTPSSPTCAGSSTLKEKQGLTISLVLPTLDEEETIGPIVRKAMREMVGRVPLLDEVLVIDSASTDRTREIAEAEGARVVQHPDVLARYGSFRGKGEALWKSLYETSGDIVVWADTDVKNWHPRMVYGTLGPLLHEPRLQYVKGYYQRPIVEERRPQGGRRRPRHRARRAPADQPLLPGALGDDPAARRGVRRPPLAPRDHPVLHRLRGRDRPPHRRRRARRHRRASARSTSSDASIATRSSRACRGCRSSSSRP